MARGAWDPVNDRCKAPEGAKGHVTTSAVWVDPTGRVVALARGAEGWVMALARAAAEWVKARVTNPVPGACPPPKNASA